MSARLLALLAVTLMASPAVGDWRGAGGLSGSVIFTDNLFLSSEDTEAGGVIRMRPFISSSRSGNRVRTRFDYGPSVLFYPGHSELNDVQHTLQASLNMEVIERYFFLDMRATANQALIDPRVNSRFDAIGGNDAFAQQASVAITPGLSCRYWMGASLPSASPPASAPLGPPPPETLTTGYEPEHRTAVCRS